MELFNEAFWFFYMVEKFDALPGVAAGAFMVGLFVAVAFCMFTECKDDNLNAVFIKWIRRYSVFVAVLAICAILAPPPIAFYAGAGQYVGEVAELDETLLKVKKLVDAKLDELSPESK